MEGAWHVLSGSKPAMSLIETVMREIGVTASPADCGARYRNHKTSSSNESQSITNDFLSVSLPSLYRLALDLLPCLCSGM